MHAGWQDAFLRYLTDVRQLSPRTAEAYAQDVNHPWTSSPGGGRRAYDWAGGTTASYALSC